MKNKNQKKAIIAVIVGVLAITSAALYFGNGEAFQGYFRRNLSLKPSINTNQKISVTCSPDKKIINPGEEITWTGTIRNVPENTSVSYKWSGDVGDEDFSRLKSEYLTRKNFTTFYSRGGTYTPSLKIITFNDVVEAKCSPIEVTKTPLPLTSTSTFNPSAIKNALNAEFSVSCSPSKSTVNTGEIMTWKTTVNGTKSGDTLTYKWGRATGDDPFLNPGPSFTQNALTKSEFTTFYNTAGTYIVDVEVKRTETASAGGWAPAGETVQTTCSVVVEKPKITVPKLATNTIGNTSNLNTSNLDFAATCSPSNSNPKFGEAITWEAQTVGVKTNDSLAYTWSEDVGDVYTGNNVLHKQQFSSFYRKAGNHTIKLTVEKTTPYTGEGWAPLEGKNKETFETQCSIDVQPR